MTPMSRIIILSSVYNTYCRKEWPVILRMSLFKHPLGIDCPCDLEQDIYLLCPCLLHLCKIKKTIISLPQRHVVRIDIFRLHVTGVI